MIRENRETLSGRYVNVGDLVAANYSVDTLIKPDEGLGIVIEIYRSSANTAAPDRCLVTFSQGDMLLLDEDDLLRV